MIRLIFILIILKSNIALSQTIVIRHLGPNDKTFHALRFRNDTLKQNDEKYRQTLIIERWINLNNADFKFLEELVNKYNSKVTFIRKEEYIYGAFSVQIQKKKRGKTYYLLTKSISLEYFKNLVNILNSNEKNHIAKKLEGIISRISN